MWMLKLSSPIFKEKKGYHLPLKIYLVSWGAMLWTWPIILAFFGKLPHFGWWLAPPMFTFFGVIVLYVLFLGCLNYLSLNSFEILWIPLEWGNKMFSYLSAESSWTLPWGTPPIALTILYYTLLCAIGLVTSLCIDHDKEKTSDIVF